MRLFLLPISSKRTLIYCKKLGQVEPGKGSYVDRITTKAATMWIKWEKGDKKWQKTVTEYGNAALKRIAYEEWGLKSIPPLTKEVRERVANGTAGKAVQVAFPGSLIRQENVISILRKLGSERQSLHKNRMIWSIVGMPISAPVALIPIIPNLPFFYLVFRAWSHWRAWSGSQHLMFLCGNGLIESSPSMELDAIYDASSAASSSTPTPSFGVQKGENEPPEVMLLAEEDGLKIADSAEVPELAPEIERAVAQVRGSLRDAEEAARKQEAIDAEKAKQ